MLLSNFNLLATAPGGVARLRELILTLAVQGNPVIVDTDIEFSVKKVSLFKYYATGLSCPKYLLLVLQTEAAGMKERAAGGVQSFISLGQLRSTVVAFPPLPEQSRIVARVTALRQLCTDLRQRLAQRQSVQSRLAKALVAQAGG